MPVQRKSDTDTKTIFDSESHHQNYANAAVYIPHSHSIVPSHDAASIERGKFFRRAPKRRASDPSEICAHDFEIGNFNDRRFARLK
jgi:hypothetical protein